MERATSLKIRASKNNRHGAKRAVLYYRKRTLRLRFGRRLLKLFAAWFANFNRIFTIDYCNMS
jgi:hypothetical protein